MAAVLLELVPIESTRFTTLPRVLYLLLASADLEVFALVFKIGAYIGSTFLKPGVTRPSAAHHQEISGRGNGRFTALA